MKSDWLDYELSQLTDEQKKCADEEAMGIMLKDDIRHRVNNALRETLRLESEKEQDQLINSDEYSELSDDFITEVAYIAAVHRIKQAIKNNHDDIAASELENREVA